MGGSKCTVVDQRREEMQAAGRLAWVLSAVLTKQWLVSEKTVEEESANFGDWIWHPELGEIPEEAQFLRLADDIFN